MKAEREIICRLNFGANVSSTVALEPPMAAARLGVGWRMVRLTPFEEGEPRAGRILALANAEGGLTFRKPLHHAIPAAAPGDYVIPDEPDAWE